MSTRITSDIFKTRRYEQFKARFQKVDKTQRSKQGEAREDNPREFT